MWQNLTFDELFGRDAVAEALILMGKKLFFEVSFPLPDCIWYVFLPGEPGCLAGGGGVVWCVVLCCRWLCFVLTVCKGSTWNKWKTLWALCFCHCL